MRFDAGRKFEIIEDSNGYLVAQGVIASAGEKLVYKDGIETVTESALFENVDEWEGLPVTVTHPKSLLNPKNTQKHQAGSVIKAWRDGKELWVKFKATTDEAIKAIKSNMRGLSAGYNVALDDAKNQIKRFNNHLAIVPVGRSPSSGIRADGRDSYDMNGDKQMPMIKFPNGKEIKLDASDAEVELVQSQIDSLASRADEAETSLTAVDNFLAEHIDADDEPMSKKLDKMKAEMDAMNKNGDMGKKYDKLKAEYDAMKKEMEGKPKMDSDDVSSLFAAYEKAVKFDSEITFRKDDKSLKTERELYVEALNAVDVKLDESESDEYVKAYVDVQMKNLGAKNQRGDAAAGGKTNSGMTVQQRADAKFYGKGE